MIMIFTLLPSQAEAMLPFSLVQKQTLMQCRLGNGVPFVSV